MVKEYVDERENSGAMFHPRASSLQDQRLEAVQNIADQLFPFPTPDFPHFRTFVNEPEPVQKVFTNYGNELEPDILVLQWPEKIPAMVAEVVTEDMLTDDNAENVWAVEARLEDVRFFLYVPAGYAKETKALLKKHKIKGVSLRTWRNIMGLNTIDINALR